MKNLKNDQDGAVAIIVAVSLVAILFGVLSLSIDLNRTQTSYTHNYNGTDAAALAGAEMWLNAKVDAIGRTSDPLDFRPSDSSMTEFTKEIMRTNFAQDQGSSTFLENSTFQTTMSERTLGDGKTRFAVEVYACAEVGTPISTVPDHNQNQERPGTARTCTTSTAAFDLGTLENTEVAFALDFTESMYFHGINQGCPPGGANGACPSLAETKADALKKSMEYVLNSYFDDSANGTAFASIVPYTGFVNVAPYDNNGVVDPVGGAEKLTLDGSTFYNSDYSNDDNSWSKYRPIGTSKTTGPDMRSYVLDSNFHRAGTFNDDGSVDRLAANGYTPFFQYPLGEGADSYYATENYTSILNRVPAILSSEDLRDITNSPNSTSFLPFDNYFDAVQDMKTRSLVTEPDLSSVTAGFSIEEANRQLAEMVCYQYTVAAAADERLDGALFSNQYSSDFTSNRNIELHESFPIQPLTNDPDVLNSVLNRYTANTRLRNTAYPSGGTADLQVIDFQSEKIDKARLASIYHNTSSIHGLMWAWFTINPAWQDIWNENSVHEDYESGSKSARDGSFGDALPSQDNFKHIILISDGFDNDGCAEVSGGSESDIVGDFLGRRNACDAYSPAEPITDNQYNDLCTAIKQGDPNNSRDDTIIHIVTLDFDANESGLNDRFCSKGTGENNRFNQCATDGEYYNNVAPDALEEVFDNIFAGILTKAVPVRLID